MGIAAVRAFPSRSTVVSACAAVVLATGTRASTASAQWMAIPLNPSVATVSYATGVDGGQQVGYAIVDGVYRAILWTGVADPWWVNLNPPGAIASYARGAGGGQQVGQALVVGLPNALLLSRAILWRGTAASWVDLNPVVSWQGLNPVWSGVSSASGADGFEQVGYAEVGGNYHAGVWRGTAASWQDLNPAGATSSEAYGVNDGWQVGYAMVDAYASEHASLWRGTAASWKDLNPNESSRSKAYGVHDGHQAGYVTTMGGVRASLWNSEPNLLRVNLQPVAASSSIAYGVYGYQQVGSAIFNNRSHAGVWSSTAASWIDLHTFLPVAFFNGSSQARGIFQGGGFTYVAGDAYSPVTGRTEAVLWTKPVVHGNGDMNGDGKIDGDDIQPFMAALIRGRATRAGFEAADMNGDGAVNEADRSEFVNRLRGD